jgi:hypothetical protein
MNGYYVMNVVRKKHKVNCFDMPLKSERIFRGTRRLLILHALCRDDFVHCLKGNMGDSFEKRSSSIDSRETSLASVFHTGFEHWSCKLILGIDLVN